MVHRAPANDSYPHACVELAKSVENSDLIGNAYRIHSRIYPELKEAVDQREAQVSNKGYRCRLV